MSQVKPDQGNHVKKSQTVNQKSFKELKILSKKSVWKKAHQVWSKKTDTSQSELNQVNN